MKNGSKVEILLTVDGGNSTDVAVALAGLFGGGGVATTDIAGAIKATADAVSRIAVEAYEQGYDKGINNGYSDGFDEGYDSGEYDGWNEALGDPAAIADALRDYAEEITGLGGVSDSDDKNAEALEAAADVLVGNYCEECGEYYANCECDESDGCDGNCETCGCFVEIEFEGDDGQMTLLDESDEGDDDESGTDNSDEGGLSGNGDLATGDDEDAGGSADNTSADGEDE